MKSTLAKIFACTAGLLLLAGCTQPPQQVPTTNPATPNTTATVPVVPVTPSAAPGPLAKFSYTGGSGPRATFTVPAKGFAVTVVCKVSKAGEAVYLHYVANRIVSGEYGFICDGNPQYQVVRAGDVKAAKIAGKKMTLTIAPASIKRVTSLTMRVTNS